MPRTSSKLELLLEMAVTVFVAMMWGFWIVLTCWWVVSPKHFPLNPNMTRMWVFVYTLAIWLVLFIILIALLPDTATSQIQGAIASKADMIGFIVSFGVTIGLIIWSLQAKKNHDPLLLKAFIKSKQKTKKPKIDTPQAVPIQSLEDIQVSSSDTILSDTISNSDLDDALMGDSPIVRIDYQNEKGERSFRSIRVIDVFYSDNKNLWYIKAVDLNKSSARTFRLDRIDSAECNGKFFYDQKDILKLLQETEVWV